MYSISFSFLLKNINFVQFFLPQVVKKIRTKIVPQQTHETGHNDGNYSYLIQGSHFSSQDYVSYVGI